MYAAPIPSLNSVLGPSAPAQVLITDIWAVGQTGIPATTDGFPIGGMVALGTLLAAAGSGTTITCTVGSASATGPTALLNKTLQTSVAAASATGATALVSQTLQAAPGNASATGVSASISTGGSTTISCTVGGASATGVTAQLNRIFGVGVGNAIASGVTANTYSGQLALAGALVGARLQFGGTRPGQVSTSRASRIARTTR